MKVMKSVKVTQSIGHKPEIINMASGPVKFLRCLKQALVQADQKTRGESKLKETARFVDTGKSRHRHRNHDSSLPTALQPSKTLSVTEECTTTCEGNYLERLPCEIILKILAFLDASSLFSISFISKKFHDLANSNVLWSALYNFEIEKKRWWPRVSLERERMRWSFPEEKPAGYWRRLVFKEMAGYKDSQWKSQLKDKNPHTGMPTLTEGLLSQLQIQWEITLTSTSGRESVYKQTRTWFEDSSVTVCWSSGYWPQLQSLQHLELHGSMCQSENRPKWRSLIFKTALNKGVFYTFLSHDRLIKVLQFDKIIIGAWRGSWRIAFIIISLHFHKLIEKSLFGSRFCTYLPTEDDAVDPDCSSHGYTLHIVLHNSVQQIICQRFSPLYTSRVGAHLQLKAIDFPDVSSHKPLAKISLPWEAGGLHGEAEKCCLMTLTVLDEGQRPFWCVSSPVKMCMNQRVVDLEYEGEQFIIIYEDAEGKVKMTFVWLEEIQRYFLVQLLTTFPVAKVKKHFGLE